MIKTTLTESLFNWYFQNQTKPKHTVTLMIPEGLRREIEQ